MSKKNVAILFGGLSSEHEVSIKSACTIMRHIPNDKYDIITIGITKNGRWLLYSGNIDNIENGSWENDLNNLPAYITPDPSIHGIMVLKNNEAKFIKIDVVIPVLHGKNGEDGTIQGLLTLSKIPFVGCNTISSAMCMDKVVTNIMLENAKIEQANFTWITKEDFNRDIQHCICKIENELKSYPIFVKPANAGSSVGISKAHNREELVSAINTAICEDDKILFEESINGQEVECAILGNDNLISSPIGEIAPSNEFYDYDAKYLSNSKLLIPAHISEEISEKIKQIALRAYKFLGCQGLSRIDFFVEQNTNRVLLNEINTFPGFTSISMYPMLMNQLGISLPELIDRLISLALERNERLNAK